MDKKHAGQERQLLILLVEDQQRNEIILKKAPFTQSEFDNGIYVTFVLESSVDISKTMFTLSMLDIHIVVVDFLYGTDTLQEEQKLLLNPSFLFFVDFSSHFTHVVGILKLIVLEVIIPILFIHIVFLVFDFNI